MYSCEKCNKLRNGIKFSRVLALPEILCVHLKRFRHDLSYSSKISSPVIFPLTNLDMQQYLHKDCKSKAATYDLNAVICHHGTVGSGHYICYAKHSPSNKWYEFDDQTVTQVSSETVQNCEAYVLFYQKNNPQMENIRSQVQEIINRNPFSAFPSSSDIKFYISKQWLNKFNTFAEPGKIDNSNVLCVHGSLLPNISAHVSDLLVPINQVLWEFFFEKFGGGPVCNHIIECDTCKSHALEIERRQVRELEIFSELRDEFQNQDNSHMLFAISMNWFRRWQAFARGETSDDPGPINNVPLISNAQQNEAVPIRNVRPGSDYAQINLKLWKFFLSLYGGGPEIILRGAHNEISKYESESDLADTAENLSLNDKPEDMETMMKDEKDISVSQQPLKQTKTVSFEDTNNFSSSDGSDFEDKVKYDKLTQKPESVISKKIKKNNEIHAKTENKKRTEQTSMFGAEGEN
jgi:ubiquitin carboxyl-terminal hydrolase 20/33